MKENHVIDVIKCDKIGGEVCEFEKDICLVTKGGGMHKLITICEKVLVYKRAKIKCHGLKEVRILAEMEERENGH